ncbi:TPA: transposase family protein [Corynebacterium striatum]|nr:transposase family protein [Corynebacterium striatum]
MGTPPQSRNNGKQGTSLGTKPGALQVDYLSSQPNRAGYQVSTKQGSGPYTSQAFRSYCSSLGVRQSMGAVGTSADNALAESFNATLKREVLRDRKVFDNPIICRQEVFRWCMRYNTRRRHSWCNLLAPDDFEALTSATLTKAA